ncbi:MAG: DUF1425 domain-containing protein [Phycisphaerales bacterium]
MISRSRPIALCLSACFVLLALSLSGGCASEPVDPRDYENPERPLAKIAIANPDLQKWMRFEPPTVVRDEDGFVTRVEVVAYATSVNTLKVDYRPTFLDRNGVAIEPVSSWRTRFLEPNVPERFILKPNGKNAVDYQLSLRWSH